MIARHEPILDDTTNVAEIFPGRQTTKALDDGPAESTTGPAIYLG
jgi:hypothetical protein